FVEPTVGHRANVAKWRQRRHFAAFALSCIGVKHGDFLFRFFAGTLAIFCRSALLQLPRPCKILANGQRIILPFLSRSSATRSTSWRHRTPTKCALIQTSLRFVCRAICDAQKTEKRREFSGREFSGQDVQL
ncbi:TPA: hypothetical protein ACW4ZS_004824, partial [Salmonella enterica subsp. enterica serovar Schwarzengrund]